MTPRICIVLILILIGMAGAHGQVGLSPDELKLLHLVNDERKSSGMAELQWDDQLAKAARAHAQLLVQHQELTHVFPGEQSLGNRIGATGLRFNSAAENVAAGPSAEELHRAMMDSPPHRANIMSAKYNAIGVAIVPVHGTLYVTQNFAYVLPAYTEEQFLSGVVAAFNNARREKGLEALQLRADPRLRDTACDENADVQKLLSEFSAISLVVFTSSVPERLGSEMRKAAGDPRLRTLKAGVCFKPGPEHGYGSFRVVVVLFPGDSAKGN